MGRRLKFNLVLLLVFALGFAITAYVSWNLLQRNAREEVVRNADLMMEAALAIRSYTVDQVRPQLDLQLMRVFLPQSVPAFAATETLGQIKKKYADYSYIQYAGLHRDKHVREHEVYEVQMAPSASRAAASPAEPAATREEPAAPPEPTGAARFDAAVLERLATALALEIGPVAKLIVRREAERAADAHAERIAEHVPDERRGAFIARVSERSAARPAAEPAAGGGPGSGPAERPPRAIEPDVLSQAEQLLARRIGPLARILVRQAAKHAATSRELFDHRALHIDDATGRQAFLAEAERYT